MPRNHHDALFKAVFAQPDQAAAHFRGALPPEVVQHLELDALRHSPGSFVDEELSDRHADLLFEVPTTWGSDALVYVLFEHQSTPDPRMPFRLLAYMVRIWQHWLDEHPKARELPAIVPLVLYHGHEVWTAPASFAALLDVPDAARTDLEPWLVDGGYVLQDLGEVEDEDLWGRALGRLTLALFKHARAGELWERLPKWAATLRQLQSESGLRALELVMRYVVEVESGPPAPELQRLLEEKIGAEAVEAVMSWAQKLREEGREEGRREEARTLLLRLIERRFGALPDEVTTKIAIADSAMIEAWTDRLFVAETPEDVVAD